MIPPSATCTIGAIENGTVIDHIPAGQAMRIYRLLKLDKHRERIAIGLNIDDETGKKDIIKVEGVEIAEEAASFVRIFAPSTMIAIIRDGVVVEKYQVPLPKVIQNTVRCPNPQCITNFEQTDRQFLVQQVGRRIWLCCHFCGQTRAHDEMVNYEV